MNRLGLGKKAMIAVMGITLLGSPSLGSSVSATAIKPELSMILDDVPLTLGVKPMLKNNVTLVPFRALANTLGIAVTWEAKTKTIYAQGLVDGVIRNVVLRVGQKTASVDGKTVDLTAAPMVVNNQTLIPLSFFGTQFGAKVSWSKDTNIITIVSPKKAMHLRAFYALGSFGQRARISSMDSVAFGWTRINEKGELTLEGADYYWPEAAGEVTPEALVQDSSAQGAKPYLMVYSVDGKGELTKMLSDETLRNTSIDHIVRLAEDTRFDGVLLDFEGLGLWLDPLGQQKLLNDYVQVLDAKLEAKGVKLSLAVPPPNSNYKGYDYKTLATYADDLVIMAYDYNPKGTPDHTPEPNTKVEEAIQMMVTAGIPAEKIILGISLWNETTETVDDKLGLAKRYGLKGASFWRLTFYGNDFANAIDRVVEKVGE
ncbi:stalk domain-containing protein [Cohnella sp. WQ 127256]|uniref:stalk domain-containing protein n=1 Tax=Cohnella sp. WQ 127256 TaxID=2938790 RepID=UPI00211912B0|nr:stalk domain-containing protein [Cohnella sp. WQ 127256]